ncbi:uncharacterized protein ATC70_011068 [Mucor velutinosus]|uniref:Histidine kinase n=1 Tax=Mucor velutinosus TaxID=708070 RepID=A0AAN7DER8_9FUNG|nr:hypothetical protein ATC70_011068 [Mucor velutinosus]
MSDTNNNITQQQQQQQQQTDVIMSTIYKNCFPEVSDAFLEKLVKEIALSTGVQTVMIQRLLTSKEYYDLKHNEGCPYINVIDHNQHDENSQSRETSPVEAEYTKNKKEYMLIKACYSNVNHNALSKHSAVPISFLQPNSPHIQTIHQENYAVIAQFNSVYPPFQTFIGTRLDQDQTPIGLMSIMDDKPLNPAQLRRMQQILLAVKTRVRNEIERTRQREQLVMVKNAAIKDAQGKIKFLADMSHEIRTPMNAVIALTDLLLQERAMLNEEQTEHLEVIQTSGNHLLTVINDILDISKINHDPKFKLEQRRFSIRKCVKDALNMARHQASMTQYNKLVCVAECPPDINDNIPLNQLINQLELNQVLVRFDTEKTVLPLLWKIDSDVPDYLTGDSMRLTQILLNLCSNAVKFTKKGGIRVKISVHAFPGGPPKPNEDCKSTNFKERYDAKSESIYSRATQQKRGNNMNSAGAPYYYEENEEDPGTTTEEDIDASEKVVLEISVTDTGIGMPADRLPRLFKSFSQIDISTARRYGGTGLGLAISSMLVNRMGGGLWVESEEGLGSRFALTLPLSVASKRPPSITTSSFGHVSESSSAYTSSGMIASPPSPGSSVSDGGSSVGEQRSNIEANGNIINTIASSPSNSTGYFTTNTNNNSSSNSNKHINNQTSFPWEHTTIPSTPSPSSISSNDQGINIYSNTNVDSLISNNNAFSNPSNPLTSNISLTMNISKGLQNMLSKSHELPTESPINNPNNNNTLNNNNNITNTTTMTTTTTTTTNNNNNNNNTTASTPQQQPKQQQVKDPKPTNSPKAARATISKHHRKSHSIGHEENLALLYPIKILLAEDNVLNQKIAVSILKRLGFQDVIIAGNGREVLELMRVHTFDVIFMDLYMPEMDGLEATRYIISERKHNVPPPPILPENGQQQKPLLNVNDVYIIALTASASKQDRQICIDAGMNDFISKPFTMMEMKSALKNCASKRKKRKKQQQLSNENKD